MKAVVYSHKPCWKSDASPSGYATDGGFPFQMKALSELFEATTLVVPCSSTGQSAGEIPLVGHELSIAPVSNPIGSGIWRKIGMLQWAARNGWTLISEALRADVVHAPIPGDIGTIGMLLAFLMRKPLLVRHCGNWFIQRTTAERFWRWFMEKFAGGRNVMLATGGAASAPSERNPNVRWIFSTSLTEQELSKISPRAEHSLSQNIRLIIVCRQEREKGTGIVIESLPLILQSFPNVTLDVVGDGAALKEFNQLAVDLKVNERVTFHGKLNHSGVMSLLERSDLFCYPTAASEGFPKVVLEALACGLPVITTRVSVLTQLIGNGCGLLLEEATPEAMAQAVKEVLFNADRYRTMSYCAGETAKQYSLERWRDTIGGLLQTAWGPLNADV